MANEYFAEQEEGMNKRPLTSAENIPERYVPFTPGDQPTVYKKLRNISDLDFSGYSLSGVRDEVTGGYGGKYFKGSLDSPHKFIQGSNQPWTAKLANGLASNTISVGTKFFTGVGELTGGAYDLVTNLTVPGLYQKRKEEKGTAFPNLFENFFTKGMDIFENEILKERWMPVYGGKKYYSDSLLRQMGDMKFWSSDLADAVAFTAAAYIPVAGWTKVAKGLGWVARNPVGKVVLNSKGKMFTTLASAGWNTGMEAALEGKEALDNIREDLSSRYYSKPYKMLDDDEKKRVNSEAGPHAANVFNSNVGILLGPNLIQSRFFIGPVRNASQKVRKAVMAGTATAKDIKVLRNVAKNAALGIWSEGAWEEGMQEAVRKYEATVANKTSFLNRVPGYLYNWVDNFYTTEGQKSMFMGALIGFGMGARAGALEKIEEKKELSRWENVIKNVLQPADNILATDIKHPFKTFIRTVKDEEGKENTITSILNEDGEVEWDFDKLLKLYNNNLFNKSLFNELLVASLNDDQIHEKFILTEALSRLAYKYLNEPGFMNGREAIDTLLERNPFDKLAQDEELKDFDLDYDYMANKARQAGTEWDALQKNMIDKKDLEGDSTWDSYKRLVVKAAFYNRMKLRWLEEAMNLTDNKDEIAKMIEDTNNALEILENKNERKQLYDEYIKYNDDFAARTEQYEQERKKDVESLETKKLRYIIDEEQRIYGFPRMPEILSITGSLEKKTGELGLRNKFYYELGKDALRGIKLESLIQGLGDGGVMLGDIVDQMKSIHDLSQDDIDIVTKAAETYYLDYVKNNTITEDQYIEKQGEIDSLREFPEELEGMTEDEIEEAIKLRHEENNKQFEYSIIINNDFKRAREELDNIYSTREGKGVLEYMDLLDDNEQQEAVFQRQVADEIVEEADALNQSFNANKEAFNNLTKVENILNKIKLLKDIYEKTELKERLSKKAFKGFIENINKAIDNIEKNILPVVEENSKIKKETDVNDQIKRNKRRFNGLGLKITDEGTIEIEDQELYNLIENIIGKNKLDSVLQDAKESGEMGDRYLFHEIFIDKILYLIKDSKNNNLKNDFIKTITLKHENEINKLKDLYVKINERFGVAIGDKVGWGTINRYIDNHEKNFKDVILALAGRPDPNYKTKNPIDKFITNNNVSEFIDNLMSHEKTGYLGATKEELLSIAKVHYNIVSLNEIIEDNKLDKRWLIDQIAKESTFFAEYKKAPTDQQLNVIRQAVRWFLKPLRKIDSDKAEDNRFLSWLFIKGSAGTGKTKVVINFILRSLGIDLSQVQLVAPNERAASLLKENTISTVDPITTSKIETLSENIRLVMIDEIAALNNEQLENLSNKLYEINSKRDAKNKFRVIVLGDPGQVQAREPGITETLFEPVVNTSLIPGSKYITVTDPLTWSHRSIIPEINDVNDIFENNNNEVKNISVYASNEIGSESIGVHAGNIEQLAQQIAANQGNGKSKVVVVFNESQKEKLLKDKRYDSVKNDILIYTDVAGFEYDEVYVALSSDQFYDTKEFNKAYYTASSRAKQYVFLYDATGTFKSKVKPDIRKAFEKTEDGKAGQYNEEDNRIKKEIKENFERRNLIEKEVLTKDTKIRDVKDVIKKKEDDKSTPEKDKETDNYGDVNIDNEFQTSEVEDEGQSEEEATPAGEKIQEIAVIPEGVHRLDYPTNVHARYINKDIDSLGLKLRPEGGEVIYVKTRNLLKGYKKDYTIRILGQLYDDNGNPVNNRYLELGVVSEEEYEDKVVGRELVRRADRPEIADVFNIVKENEAGVIELSFDNPDTILMRGKIKSIRPLTYTYEKGKVLKGEGFLNKVFDLVNHKYFRRSDVKVRYSIKIFKPSDFKGEQYLSFRRLRKKYYGVPYLLIDTERSDGRGWKTQFVRLNPQNIKKNDPLISKLSKFYNAIVALEKETVGKGRMGDPQFNNIIGLFKKNYKIEGEDVVKDSNILTYAEYRNNNKVLKLDNADQFKRITKLMDDIIPGIYGKGLVKLKFSTEKEMLDYFENTGNKLDEKLSDGKYQYSFIKKEEQITGSVFRKLIDDKTDKGDYMYVPGLVAGKGTAQNALNIIAKANSNINGFNIRVSSFKLRSRHGLKSEPVYVTGSKSMLNTDHNNAGYYDHLRRVLVENDYVWQEPIFNDDGSMTHTEYSSIFITDENADEARDIIIANNYDTEENLNNIYNQYHRDPITSDVLKAIVEDFTGDTHNSIRTPLPMNQINSWGTSDNIMNHISDLEKVLQTNLTDIINANVDIEPDFKELTIVKREKKKSKMEGDDFLPRRLKKKAERTIKPKSIKVRSLEEWREEVISVLVQYVSTSYAEQSKTRTYHEIETYLEILEGITPQYKKWANKIPNDIRERLLQEGAAIRRPDLYGKEIILEDYIIPERLNAKYATLSGGKMSRVSDTHEQGQYFRIFDIEGDTAKYEFYGDETEAIARRVPASESAFITDGSLKTATKIKNIEPGTLRKNENGEWVIVKKAKILLIEKSDTVFMLDDKTKPVYLGRSIPRFYAKFLIKKSVPGITNKEIQFVEKHVVDSIAKELGFDAAWGAFKNGVLFIAKNKDGSVYENICRHEVFHKIYREYLTEEEKKKVDEFGRKEFSDFNKFATTEELLAVKYQDYERGVLKQISEFFKSLFLKIKRLLGLYEANFNNIEEFFDIVRNGLIDYRRVKADNSTALMIDIKRKFGSIDNYISAMDTVLRMFKDSQTKHVIRLTNKEIRESIRKRINRIIKEYDIEYNNTGDKEYMYNGNYYRDIADNYGMIINDIFPGFNNYKNGTFYSRHDLEVLHKMQEEKEGNDTLKGKLPITENDRSNSEDDVTDDLKEFLSYIEEVNSIGERTGNLLPWRYAFIKMIGLMEGLSLEQGNIIEQLKESFETKKMTNNESSVLKYLTDLYSSVINEVIDSRKLDERYRFITKDIFIYDIGKKKIAKDVKHEHDKPVRDGLVGIIKRYPGESNQTFAAKIISESGITREQLKAHSTHNYYTEMWNKLVSHFNSHRQRNPKIGERYVSYGAYKIRYINARGSAVINGLADHITNQIDAHVKTDNDLSQLIKKIKEWKRIHKDNDLAFVREFFDYINLKEYGRSLTTYHQESIAQSLPLVFDKIQKSKLLGTLKPIEDRSKTDEDDVIVVDEEISREWTLGDILNDNYRTFVNDLSEAVGMMDNLSRILTTSDAKNERRYNAVYTSFAHKIIFNVIKTAYEGGRKTLQKINRFNSDFYKGNIFINGTNKIYRHIDDDGLKTDDYFGNEYNIEYKREKREDYNFRVFVLGFLSSIKYSSKRSPRYIQFMYPNERKTPFGVEVNVLKREELIKAIQGTIVQIKNRDKKNERKYKNYNVNSFIGFEVLNKVLPEGFNISDVDTAGSTLTSHELAVKIYNLLDKESHKTTKNIVYDKTALDSDLPYSTFNKEGNEVFINEVLDNLIDRELYPDASLRNISKNESRHIKLFQTKEEFLKENKEAGIDEGNMYESGESKKYLVTEEMLRPYVSLCFINNYINSYHYAQLIAGDHASFESSTDLIRRINIAYAPGKTGYIDDKHGMNRYARAAIISDPVKDNDKIRKFYKTLIKDISDKQLDSLMKFFPEGGFKPGDAQGFVLPERRDDINKGFGESFGNVLKGVYYSVDENGIPIAIKYSSIVLSDELCDKHEALSILRDKMRNNIVNRKLSPIDEVIFATGIKVGLPHDNQLNDFYQLVDPNSNTYFNLGSQFIINNADYRIQFDPESDLDSGVSYPTQLSYIMKLYGTNNEIALDIYSSVMNIIRGNFERYDNYISGKDFGYVLKKLVMKGKQQHLADLINDGIHYNFPSISDKIIPHFISTVFDNVVKITFPGTKLILQSALGANKKFDSTAPGLEDHLKRELEIVFKGDSLAYEVILPKGFLHPEVEKKIQQDLENDIEPEDMFLGSKDAIGFRIPSSELHSAIPIKVVGFYDSAGTNVIIAPKMLVVLHGSDFDIDALFTIKREYISEYNRLAGIADDIPIGYNKNENGKYVFNRNFKSEINKIAKPDLRAKVNEAYYLNRITENYISAISSKENAMRMLSPIYLGELHKEADEMKELTGNKDKVFDPSNMNDAQEIHDIIFSGESGIGIAASMFKAFAFMHLAEDGKNGVTSLKKDLKMGVSRLTASEKEELKELKKIVSLTKDYIKIASYENITEKRDKKLNSLLDEINSLSPEKILDSSKDHKDLIESAIKIQDYALNEISLISERRKIEPREGKTIRFNGFNYDRMVDLDLDVKEGEEEKTSGYRFDSLINAALDNYKEMILPYINGTRETLPVYSIMIMHGIGFKTINRFINQPILRYLSKYGRRDFGQIERKLHFRYETGMIDQIELTDELMEKYLKYTPEEFQDKVDNTKDNEEDLEFLRYQLAVFEQYNVLKDISDSMYSVTRLANIIRTYPNKVSGLRDILNETKSMLGIPYHRSITTEPNDDDSVFPYYMKHFLNTNEHIRESLIMMQWLLNKIESEFISYKPAFKKIANNIYSNTKATLDRNTEENKKLIRDEFMRFIMSSLVNRNSPMFYQYTYILPKRKRENVLRSRTATGIEAHGRRFAEMIEIAQRHDAEREIRSLEDPNDEDKYSGNIFLRSLSVKMDWKGRPFIFYHAPSTMDPKDLTIHKNSFLQMNYFDFKFINGKYEHIEIPEAMRKDTTDFMKMFVDNAIFSYGMGFGMRNYTKAIPGTVYKDYSSEFIEMADEITKVDNDTLKNISNAFEAQFVMNHANKMIGKSNRIRVDNKNTIQRFKKEKDPKTGVEKTIYGGAVELQGQIKFYYDRWFESKTGLRKWPKWHIEKYGDDVIVFRRISPEENISGFYTRLGKMNDSKLYDLKSIDDIKKFNEDEAYERFYNSDVIKTVKGSVVADSQLFFSNRDDLNDGQIVYISEYTDPGNIYGDTYRIIKRVGEEMYRIEKAKNFPLTSYYDDSGSNVRKAYDELLKRLVKKDMPYRSFKGRIIVKKDLLNVGRPLYQKINKEEFNGLKVLYERQTAFGIEIFINGKALEEFYNGKQLELFSKGYEKSSERNEKIINDVVVSDNWNKLTNTLQPIEQDKVSNLNMLWDLYDNRTTDQILDDIESRTTNAFQKKLVGWVRSNVNKIGTIYSGDRQLEPNKLGRSEPTGEIYIDLVQINAKEKSIKDIDRIILHEFVHSITTLYLYDNNSFRSEVKKYINYILEVNPKLRDRFKLAFKDADELGSEFIAEFFSNKEFYDELNKIVMPSDKKSIGAKIRDWIYSILGIKADNKLADNLDKWLRENIEPKKFWRITEDGQWIDSDGNLVLELKDLSKDYTFTTETKYLDKIVEQGLDVTNKLDDNGDETDTYVDADNNLYKRISDIYTGWVSLFRKQGHRKTYGERMADEKWEGMDKETSKEIDGKTYTYQEFQEMKDTEAVESVVRGKILHLLNKLLIDRLYNDGRNEVNIRLEIQGAAYRTYKITDSTGKEHELNINLDPDRYSWYLDKAGKIYTAHGINTFNDNIDPEHKDKIAAEVVIANKILGYAGTADMIIEHEDGTISIKDMATGYNFDKFLSKRILKYGDQKRYIKDSPRDRKKMQIMMYAFMIKIANPDIKFRDLSVMWVPNTYYALEEDPMRKVDVQDFLNMIQTFLQDKEELKNAGINENVYKELIEAAPKLFDVGEYTYEYNPKAPGLQGYAKSIQDDLISKLNDGDETPLQTAKKVWTELTKIVGMAPVIKNLGKSRITDKDFKTADRVKAMQLTQQLLELMKDPAIEFVMNDELDTSWPTSWIGNYSDMPQPYIQMWKKFRDIRDNQKNEVLRDFEKKHNAFLRPVLEEYFKKNPSMFKTKRYQHFENYWKMWGWMYKEIEKNGVKILRYKIESDPEWKDQTLTIAQKNYLTFLNNHYQSYFDGPDAFMNQQSTYVVVDDMLVPIKNIDLYNKDLPSEQKFEYYRGWFPKLPKEQSEQIYEAGEGSYTKGLFNPKFLKQMAIDSMTFYLENQYEGRVHNAMVLPFKYMGSLRIDANRKYSYNPVSQFDRFTATNEYKRFMDPVYASAEGLRALLEEQRTDGQPTYPNLPKMFEKKIISDVLGRTIRPKTVRRPIRLFGTKWEDNELRTDAVFQLARSWTSATLMWLKPFTGGGNGFNAIMLQHKDALRGSIGKLFGIEESALDYTLKDSLAADKVFFTEHVVNSMLGKMNQDKTFLLARKLRYLPDNFDYKTNDKYLLGLRNQWMTSSSMYMFHRIPEEFASFVTMIAQLKYMKHPNAIDPKTGKNYSIWDCYQVEKDANGEYDVVWKLPDGTPAPLRGKQRHGSGDKTYYTDIGELTSQEIAKFKKVYEKLQGGYRKEEATAMEAYVLGKVFIQLKKYYPRLLLNAWSSKRYELDMGYYKKMSDRKDGEDVYEWYQRYNEGRFRLLSKFFMSMITAHQKYEGKYKWSNMEPELKLHIIDAMTTIGIWAMGYFAYLKLFGDDKDDDSLKQWYKWYILDNFIQQYSPKEQFKLGTQFIQPVALTRSLHAVESLSTVMAATWNYAKGDMEEALTQTGALKGWYQLQKSFPIIASYNDFIKRIEKSEDISRVLHWEKVQKFR